jgi:Ser/Thr protein kinase RdoA (MazF antagonist)
MLKLKHLVSNEALALELLAYWQHDPVDYDLLKRFRISSNAIYPYKKNGEICFLRYCPSSEKSLESVEAEIHFIHYLRSHGFPALEPLLSTHKQWVLCKTSSWGEYLASAFRKVDGEQVSQVPLTDELLFQYGSCLGRLHHLSSGYVPDSSKRWNHEQVFAWMDQQFHRFAAPESIKMESRNLKKVFSGFSKSAKNYGLIHYDFEMDNTFYDAETGKIWLIDFDDAMYHWYQMDIENAWKSLQEPMITEDLAQKKQCFLEGYQSQYPIDTCLSIQCDAFSRFSRLYTYARLKDSIHEDIENEPDWMSGLRSKLTMICSVIEKALGEGNP